MGDDMFNWSFDEYENFAELQFVARTAGVSALDARRTVEAALRKLPDSALHGLQLLRITVVSGAKKQ